MGILDSILAYATDPTSVLTQAFAPIAQAWGGPSAQFNPVTQAVSPVKQALAQAAGPQAGRLAPYGYGSASAMPTPSQVPAAAPSAPQAGPAGPPVSAMPQPSPVAQQMTDQQQGADANAVANQSAIMNAMNPGQGNLTPIQRILQNQAQSPQLAFNQALMSAGSALMGGRNLQQGLAGAGDAFNNTLNSALNQQRQLNTPQVTPLADGAFSMVQMPGQQPQVVPNNKVQDFMMGRMKAQVGWEMMKTDRAREDQIQVNAAKTDQQQGVAAQNSLINLQQSEAGIGQAQQVTNALKADQGRANALKLYSASPAWAQRIAAASGNPESVQAASDYNTLNNAGIDATKFEVAGLNGSLSNDEFNKAAGAVPRPSDDPAVWDTYYNRVGDLLNGRKQFYTDVVNRGLAAGNRGVNPGGDNGRPVLNAPSVPSAGPVAKVASAADYNALPSGSYYTDPSGQYRRKA